MLVGLGANSYDHCQSPLSFTQTSEDHLHVVASTTASLLPINGNPRSAQCGEKEATL